jgi:hypothetical protein
MLYNSYEQVVERDNPEYWWRPGRHSNTVFTSGMPGKGLGLDSLATSAANEPYTGPGLPGAASGTSTHCVGTSGSANTQGWTTSAAHTVTGNQTIGWTMEVWIYAVSSPVTSRIYTIFNRGTGLGGFWSFGDAPIFSLDNVANVAFNTTGNPRDWQVGKWMHLVGTFRNGSNEFWVDGTSQRLGSVTNPVTATATDYAQNATASHIGRSGQGGTNRFPFPGYIAEPAIYSYPLSPSQIQDHYMAGIMPRRSTARLVSAMYPFVDNTPPPPPPPGGLTPITTGLSNRRLAVVSDRPR